MEKVLIVGPLTDISLALAKHLMERGVILHIVTDNVSEWKDKAEEIFTDNNVVTDNAKLPFSPQYTVVIPAALNVPTTLYQTGKVVSVLSHEYADQTPSIYKQFVFSSRVEISPDAADKAEQIIKQLFSFGGNTTVFTHIQKVEKSITHEVIAEPPTDPKPQALPTPVLTPAPSPVASKPKKKKLVLVIGIILLLLALPFTLLGIATALTLVGIKLVTIGELSLAREAFAASGSVSSVATVLPGASRSASMLQRITTTGEQGTYVLEKANAIMEGVFSGQTYPLTELSQELQQELNIIHRELSFLETELQKDNTLVTNFVPIEQLQKVREAAAAGADIAGRLPSLLGVEEQKTYMVLLQNNMELRPTGGFIGSFALLNFSSGRLIDAPVYDVYSADGQLKGHVEPPTPIKEYLGEANWYLRDSNWDPDFPTSAERAEWFLDKTMGLQIDGVIAIDLEFVRQLIAEQGSLEIADFDLSLTKDNFYELLQNEVHKDFFPGSRKKAAVLTATMNALMSNLLEQVQNRDVSLAKVASQALEGRHIQIHLEDPVIQQQVQVLGWAGDADPTSCTGNCEQIWVGTTEANVGVNKANYFIDRGADLRSRLVGGQWEHELTVTIVNTARGEDVDDEHNYETYLRVMAPRDAKFDRVLVQTAAGRKSLTPDIELLDERVEAGTHVEVPAGQTRVVTFLWSDKATIDVTKEGEIQVYWRKQAGVDQQPVTVNIALPEDSLTDEREFKYNSTLKTDLSETIKIGNK